LPLFVDIRGSGLALKQTTFFLDSFFDVFVEITLPDTRVFKTKTALRVSSGPFDAFPPPDGWGCIGCFAEFDGNIPNDGVRAPRILAVGEPSMVLLLGASLAALAGAAAARRRR